MSLLLLYLVLLPWTKRYQKTRKKTSKEKFYLVSSHTLATRNVIFVSDLYSKYRYLQYNSVIMAQAAKKTVRGLNVADYFRLLRRVRAGELTWAEAERQGFCKPKAKTGPKPMPLRMLSKSKRTK